jgi:hypothetical protein
MTIAPITSINTKNMEVIMPNVCSCTVLPIYILCCEWVAVIIIIIYIIKLIKHVLM